MKKLLVIAMIAILTSCSSSKKEVVVEEIAPKKIEIGMHISEVFEIYGYPNVWHHARYSNREPVPCGAPAIEVRVGDRRVFSTSVAQYYRPGLKVFKIYFSDEKVDGFFKVPIEVKDGEPPIKYDLKDPE
jgi:hypothetical protein